MEGWGLQRRWQRGLCGCVVELGGMDGWVGQRASFRVDRSGGLYQNNTVVDYMSKKKKQQRHEDAFRKRKSSQACVML